VQVIFDTAQISYTGLVNAYWHMIDPTQVDQQACDAGSSYRSIIFYNGAEQQTVAEASKKALESSGRFSQPLATTVEAAMPFYPAEEYHQKYYLKNPENYAAYRAGCGRDERLVAIWNSLPGVQSVERFTSRQVAVTRIWKAIQHLQASGGAHRPRVAAKKGSAKKKASRKVRPVARANSKTARVIALLRRSTGASMKTIMRTTGWQAHSVRGFISGQLGKKMGLTVTSTKGDDGERTYSIKA
jgi:peptide-methionine (S)-S-oxide reductase